ncbi:MAG: orotate phosphoribosyltransferase [Actinomycetota bacterium]|nr:orotate phosphoribosyltransferase [Actinomycetota bacterium]
MDLIRRLGYERRQQPFQLSSGEWSHDYIDGKRALASGESLKHVAEAVIQEAARAGVSFDAIGGPTMGADPTAHAVAVLTGTKWFSVRSKAKAHGKQKLIEGAELKPGMKVLLVEDVVTTGKSILDALDAVAGTGVEVVLALAIVDRGESARKLFEEKGVEYRALSTYEDFDIEPVAAGR